MKIISEVYVECQKHTGQSMIDCQYCQIENEVMSEKLKQEVSVIISNETITGNQKRDQILGLVKIIQQENDLLYNRIIKCRDYLMQVEPKDMTASDCLVALGYNENGFYSE